MIFPRRPRINNRVVLVDVRGRRGCFENEGREQNMGLNYIFGKPSNKGIVTRRPTQAERMARDTAIEALREERACKRGSFDTAAVEAAKQRAAVAMAASRERAVVKLAACAKRKKGCGTKAKR